MQPPFKINICGIHELSGLAGTPFSHVLSILDPGHPPPPALGRISAQKWLELRFDDVIDDLPGKVPPGPAMVAALLEFGDDMQELGWGEPHLLVHCHAGVSRSTACTAVLLAQFCPEWTGDEIFATLLHARPWLWPNLRIIELGDAALGRGGELVEAAGRLYARQIESNLDLIEYFQGLGRNRELAAGFAAGALADGEPY
jgi:predicted protein tyrosine phosphatase